MLNPISTISNFFRPVAKIATIHQINLYYASARGTHLEEETVIVTTLSPEHDFQSGDVVWNRHLQDYATIESIGDYIGVVFDEDNQYLCTGNDIGLKTLFVRLDWGDGQYTKEDWLIQDCELYDADYHLAQAEVA